MSEKLIHRSLAVLIFLISLTVYVRTMAVSVSFWDAGEFIATSYILGIPHSPGTPLYVLVGRVFCLLPLALSTAQKVNFLSALSASLGILMIYLSSLYAIRFIFGKAKTTAGRIARYAGPVTGSFFLAFSDTYWTNASEAEVYALSAFVMGFCTMLALKWLGSAYGQFGPGDGDGRIDDAAAGSLPPGPAEKRKNNSRNTILLIIYLLSLGIGFHLGTILVYAGILIMLMMVKEKAISNVELLIFTFGFGVMVADMTVHRNTTITLVLLAIFAVLVVWSTLSKGRFVLFATGLFILGISVHLFLMIRSGLNPAIDEVDPESWKSLYAVLRREQYPPMNIFARKAPLLFQIEHFTSYFAKQFKVTGDFFAGPFNLGILSALIPVGLGIFGIVANYIREKKSWALNFTNLVINSAGLIIFLNFTNHEVRERDYFYGAAFYFFAIFIAIGATAVLMLMLDQAKKTRQNQARFVVPVAAFLIICSLLPSTHQWYTHDRSDDFIARDYAYNILSGLEPDAIIFTNGDNDTFPLWYLQTVENVRPDVRVANLSLLNTSWYTKQIRDQYPTVPLDLSDEEIDRLKPIRVQDGILWKKDLLVNQIIRNTNWARPIYFAVTVPADVWDRYSDNLEMQGMVRRLVPTKGKYLVNNIQMARNLGEIFMFRGIFTEDGERDDSVYKPRDVENMFINFSIAAFQLAQSSSRSGDDEEAVQWAEMSYRFSPDFEWPRKYLGVYYMKNNQYEKAIDHYRKEIERDPQGGEFWINLAAVEEERNQPEKALEILREGMESAGSFRDIYGQAFRIAATLGRVDEAKGYIRKWIDKYPDDEEFKALYDDIDIVLFNEFGIGQAQSGDSVEGED
ncbi:MAG: DUF2723 domain-containing protein [Candidatus Krumholzibacteriota bacterium]|nr:DUF2723 domain-containing protein [Candidatus Krumholzibacteriota bacterium]